MAYSYHPEVITRDPRKASQNRWVAVDLICPVCHKYIGLWNRDGQHVGSEWHQVRRFEQAIEAIPCSLGIRFQLTRYWVCNGGIPGRVYYMEA